jgi:integrase
MSDGFYRPKYRDRKTGKVRTAKVYWARDPVSGLRVSTGARTVAGVQAWREERERRAASPHYQASHEATVGQWIDQLNTLKKARKAEGTANMYRVKLGHVARIFGESSPMAAITPESVDRFVETRQNEGASNNTIGKELTSIVQLCKHAKRRGEYTGDISALKPIGFSIDYEPRKGHLKLPWLPALKKQLEPHELAAVNFIVATSARREEYFRALRIDADVRRGLVSLRGTKTTKARRVVPIPTIFRKLLRESLPLLETKWRRITHELPERCKAADIPRLTPNDLRRTHSTWLIEAGVAKGLVQDSMGHSGPQMLDKVYNQAEAEAVLRVMEAQIATVKTSKSKPRRRTVQR